MYDRYGPLTVILLVAGLILMPVGLYLKAVDTASFVFYVGAAVLAAGIALSAFRTFIPSSAAPAEVSEEKEGKE